MDFEIDGNKDNFQYQIMAKGYLEHLMELYAYQNDNIDIFNLYLKAYEFYDMYVY